MREEESSKWEPSRQCILRWKMRSTGTTVPNRSYKMKMENKP